MISPGNQCPSPSIWMQRPTFQTLMLLCEPNNEPICVLKTLEALKL
jgi:hypothetical protein